LQQTPYLGNSCRVESIGRFVQDEQIGVGKQGGGDPEPLLHSERVRAELVAASPAEADLLQQGIDPALWDVSECG
jgi:hypothetical protein